MTTPELIKRLRNHMPPGPLAQEIMLEAAAKLESIQWELTQAIAERTPHDYGLLKEEAAFLRKERDEALAEVQRLAQALHDATTVKQQLTVCPEPSRLEIAAMLIAGSYACQDINPLEANIALKQAEKLIAAARGAK